MERVIYQTPNIFENTYKTIFRMIRDNLPSNNINVIPAYPKDMKDVKTPCICIRLVDTGREQIRDGGIVDGGEYDGMGALARNTWQYIQIDCVGSTQLERIELNDIVNTILVLYMTSFPLQYKVGNNYINTPQGETIRTAGTHSEWFSDSTIQQYICCIREMFRVPEVFIVHDGKEYTEKDLKYTTNSQGDDFTYKVTLQE